MPLAFKWLCKLVFFYSEWNLLTLHTDIKCKQSMENYSALLLFWFLKINFFMSKTCFGQVTKPPKATKKLTKLPKYNPNTFAKDPCFCGVSGEGAKKTISQRRKEGRVEKKSTRSVPAGPGAWTRDLPRARRGSPAARQGGCSDKQAFPCL